MNYTVPRFIKLILYKLDMCRYYYSLCNKFTAVTVAIDVVCVMSNYDKIIQCTCISRRSLKHRSKRYILHSYCLTHKIFTLLVQLVEHYTIKRCYNVIILFEDVKSIKIKRLGLITNIKS